MDTTTLKAEKHEKLEKKMKILQYSPCCTARCETYWCKKHWL